MKTISLTRTLAPAFLILLFSSFTFLHENAKLVSDYKYKTFGIKVFKSASINNPYNIKTTCSKTAMFRDFMVIENDNQDLKYIMIEKVGATYLYYPIAWQKLDLVSLADVKEYCERILSGELKNVDKSFIQ